MKISNIITRPLLILILLFAFHKNSHSQKLEQLAEAIQGLKPSVTFSLPLNEIDFLNVMSFGFTTQGLVAISKDRTSLVCYQPDGSVAWMKQPPEQVISAVHVSGNGNIISAYYPLNEDRGVTEVLTSDGNVLWRKDYEAAFRVSPAGKYLYSGPNALSGMPLTVIETATGIVLWKQNASDFKAELLNEETVVQIGRGDIKSIEMSTGRMLAGRDFSEYFENELSHTLWELAISDNGSYLTVLVTSGKSMKNLIQTYDSNLSLKWTKIIEPPTAQLVGISEDGSKLLITRGFDTSLYNNLTGDLLWRIEEPILNNGAVVTNKFIAMTQVGYKSEVFILAEDGSVMNRFKVNSIFTKAKLPQLKTQKGTMDLLKFDGQEIGSIVEIKKDNQANSVTFYRNVKN